MTVEEARDKRICRICEEPISLYGGPKGAEFKFGEMVYPERIRFNFGNEFAHTDCLEKESNSGKK